MNDFFLRIVPVTGKYSTSRVVPCVESQCHIYTVTLRINLPDVDSWLKGERGKCVEERQSSHGFLINNEKSIWNDKRRCDLSLMSGEVGKFSGRVVRNGIHSLDVRDNRGELIENYCKRSFS